MSARVSLASASGFSSLPRPPSRARRGSSVPPPVSVIDQVLQALFTTVLHYVEKIYLLVRHFLFKPTGVLGPAGRDGWHLRPEETKSSGQGLA